MLDAVIVTVLLLRHRPGAPPGADLVGRRWPRPPAPVVWAIVGGVIAGMLLLPTNTSRSGLAETVFTADIALIITAVARLSREQVRTWASSPRA